MRVNLENRSDYFLIGEKTLTKIAKSVLKMEGQPTKHIAISVFYVGEEEIAKINEEYRHKKGATDVITFRLVDTSTSIKLTKHNFPLEYDKGNKELYIGEIFICAEVALKQAEEWKHSHTREVAELFVHGMLHILGYDHEEVDEARLMKEKEQAMYLVLDKLVR